MTPERLADAILSGEARLEAGDRVVTTYPRVVGATVVWYLVRGVVADEISQQILLDHDNAAATSHCYRRHRGFVSHKLDTSPLFIESGETVKWTFEEIHDGKA